MLASHWLTFYDLDFKGNALCPERMTSQKFQARKLSHKILFKLLDRGIYYTILAGNIS